LAVDNAMLGKGVGRALVAGVLEKARGLGLPRVFALTLTADFFEKMGFRVVEKDLLPMKVWSDCAKCPKQQNCDETAVLIDIGSATQQ
jgi:amino-acid N-acetyltransferase